MMRKPTAVAATILLTALAGCLSITTPEAGVRLEPGPQGSVVVGRLRVFTAYGEQYPWGTEGPPDIPEMFTMRPPTVTRPVLGIFSVDRDERGLAPVPDSDGWFTWQLPAGRYLLYVLNDLHGGYSPPPPPGLARLFVLAAFRVADDSAPRYLGDLVLELGSDWQVGDTRTDYSIERVLVVSELQSASQHIAERYPGSLPPRNDAVMVSDPRLSGLLVPYSRERTESVLESLGIGR